MDEAGDEPEAEWTDDDWRYMKEALQLANEALEAGEVRRTHLVVQVMLTPDLTS